MDYPSAKKTSVFNKLFSNVYYGWWINLLTGITSGLASGYNQSFSVFFKPIAAELGLSRAATSVASSVSRLEGGIQAPITGFLSDRYGAKWVLVSGALIMGIGQLLMTYTVHSPWGYYITWGIIIATGHNLGFTLAVDKVLTNWFIRKRGLSFGVRFAVMGIMQAALLPLISWLTITYGWRTTSLVWAIIMFASIPFTIAFVKPHRPEHYGLMPDGVRLESTSGDNQGMVEKGKEYAAGLEEIEFTLKQAMRTSSYWLLIVVTIAFSFTGGAFNIHIIPFLTDRGISETAAAGMMSMMIFFTIPSRFLFGVFADKVKKEHQKYLMALGLLLMTMGITVFLLNQTMATIWVFLVLWGIGTGANTPVNITIRGRYFGRKAYGSIQGTTNMFVSPVALIAPICAGWIYDVTGNYTNAFIIFASITAAGAIVSCLIRGPKPPREVVA